MFGIRHGVMFLVFSLAASACGGSPAAPGEVPYGQRFDLKAGQRITVGDDGLAVTFVTVRSDARCPLDATCIDIGDAVLALRLDLSGREESRDIHTKPPQSQLRVDGYTITLQSLQPYPWSNPERPRDEYVAQFSVERR
jgi:hypothetical protein